MTTQKERELIAEIMSLALDIGAGEYNVEVDYSGHIHALHVRVAKKSASDWVYYGEAGGLKYGVINRQSRRLKKR